MSWTNRSGDTSNRNGFWHRCTPEPYILRRRDSSKISFRAQSPYCHTTPQSIPARRLDPRRFYFLGDLGGGMGHKKLVVLPGILASLLLAACASAPARVLSSIAPSYATLPNGYEPLNPTRPSPIYAAVTAVPGDNLIRYMERKRGHALNVLSLSGGGQNGAFGAGFLVGWRESGRRPQFDAVGGVSTGALLATHALLGTPADDAVLEQMYTRISKDDIYKDRGLGSILFGADSLSNNAPLYALLVKYVTAETLKRVAEAYDDNRMLFVGTTNIDYGQTWIWNMSL